MRQCVNALSFARRASTTYRGGGRRAARIEQRQRPTGIRGRP
jgi:hypothetical protein